MLAPRPPAPDLTPAQHEAAFLAAAGALGLSGEAVRAKLAQIRGHHGGAEGGDC